MDTEQIRAAIEYILNEIARHPDDSIVDIANEAMINFPIRAEWTEDDSKPVTVL